MRRQNFFGLALASFAVLVAPVAGIGQDCIDYAEYINWSHIVITEDRAIDIEVSGDYAFVAVLEAGLTVMDVSDPNAAFIIGGTDTPGTAVAVDVRYEYAFVADGIEGLQVVRIKNPYHPEVVANMATSDAALDILVEGRYAYVADREGGIHVVDVSSPRKPTIVATVELPGMAYDLAFKDKHLYVAGHSAGLHIIDVGNPESPFLVTSFDIGRMAYYITLVGNIAYLGGSSELCLVDISNPMEPEMLSEIPGISRGTVVVRDEIAYVAEGHGVSLIDVADPRQPEVTGEVRCRGFQFRDIVLVGESLLTAANVGVQVVTAIGQTPAEMAGQAEFSALYVWDVAVQGNYLYAIDRHESELGLKIYNLVGEDLQYTPGLLSSINIREDNSGRSYHLAVEGSYVYVADFFNGLHVLYVGNPWIPEVLASLEVENGVNDVAIAGDYAYLGCLSEGFLVVDISNPEDPVPVTSLDLNGIVALALRGNRAIIRRGEEGSRTFISEIDITDPTHPRVLGSVEVPHSQYVPSDISLLGEYAYCAYTCDTNVNEGGLLIIDISEPGVPQLVFDYTPIADGGYVAVHGLHAYLSGAGMSVLDISEPRSPVLVGRLQVLGGYTNGVAVGENAVYFGQDLHGVVAANFQCPPSLQAVVDIDIKPGNTADPVNCASRGVLPVGVLTSPDFDAMTIDHETVFFGPGRAQEAHSNLHGMIRHERDVDGDGDMDLLFHFRIQECGLTCIPGEMVTLAGRTFDGLEIIGSTTYRSVPSGGNSGQGGVVLSAWPNPFNPQTTIAFELPGPESVSLRVFDLAGRLVRDLIKIEEYTPGRHEVVWNGRDDNGRQVASGTYFYRLEAGSYCETKSMVMVK